MRHKVAGFKLKRDTGARDSLLRNLATSVILQERIITTVPKAKAVRPLVEKMITLAKRDTLHTRRQAAMVLRTPASVKKLFDTLEPASASVPAATPASRVWARARATARSKP